MSIKKNIFAPLTTGLGAMRAAMTLLLALLTTATAWATSTSTINVGGTDYTLFTGFTATDGTATGNAFVYGNMVDGNTSTSFHAFTSPAFVEFNTDDPIIPKGYIFNIYQAGSFYPQAWVLKAKANAEDGWTTLSSYSGQTLSSGQEFQYACGNDGNTAYKYFRFEASNSGNNIWLTEIRLYGFENLTYTHLTVRAATCTEVGIKQECYKRSDGKYFTDETGTTELAESAVIEPMIAHTGVHHEADANHIEYWQCSVCSKYFSDAGCTTEITEAQTLVVKYLNSNGTLTTLDGDATAMTSTTTAWAGGWYIVYDNVTIADRITVSGTVNLILGDNATLTASKGITVGSDATFNVYAQSTDEATMGALVASTEANSNNAAIGGVQGTNFGSIIINGGKITATTNNACAGAPIGGGYGSTAGNITINGGIVSATAYDYSNSAGIGGGNNGYVASVTLNGGIITATGDTHYGGAGIGTGSYASSGTMTITIGSGVKKLVATRGADSDCIGKQPNASTTVNVVFKNGETTVEGDAKTAVFYDTGEGTVRQVRAKAQNHHVSIDENLKANITAMPEYALAGETVTLTLGAAVDASAPSVNNGAVTTTDAGNRQYTFTMPDGDVTVTATVAQTYAVTLPANMQIVSTTNAADANGKYITGTTVTFKPEFGYEASNVSDGTNTLEPDGNGIYSVTVATADITVTATVMRSSTINLADAPGDFTAIAGDVLTGSTNHTLTIADGASITLSSATITGGIVCAGSATITLDGTNRATGAYSKAGIQVGGAGTTLTITGEGSLTATGGTGGAGIGTGVVFANGSFAGGNITITGGTVTAIGTEFDMNTHEGGNGIGTGYTYANATNTIGTVTIHDGINKVDASSIKDFANVVYMHGDDNVTASKTDYFTIGEDGDRRLIVQKPVIAEIAEQAYTGSAITPEPTVTIGSLSLTKGTDYEFSYENNTNVGTATVRATFQGTYASLGYVERTFTIMPSTIMVSVTGGGTVTIGDKSASDGEAFGVMSEKGASVVLTLAPEDGNAVRSVEYAYTNSKGTTSSGCKLPISDGTATFTVPNDLKDGTGVTLTVTFAAALVGGADEASAVALTDATVTDLAGGWYKVESDITFDHTLNLLGDTYLTIADGKTMTVSTASGKGIDSDYTLTVGGAGALSVTASGAYKIAVRVGNYVQTGATVTASGYIGIRCQDDFDADFTNDFTFSGGQLTVTGNGGDGIWADNTITISCTNASDFIQSSSYDVLSGGTIKVADGKALTDGTNIYSGTLTASAINGKTLRICLVLANNTDNDVIISNLNDETIAVQLQGRTLYKDGKWNTLCLPFALSAEQIAAHTDFSGATLMELDTDGKNGFDTTDGTLYLTFKKATAIAAGVPYLVKWSEDGNDFTSPIFSGVTIDATAPTTVSDADDELQEVQMVGCYSPVPVVADDKSILFLGDANTLYYSTIDRDIRSCRAYFSVPYIKGNAGAAKARAFVLNFDGEEATGILEVSADFDEKKDDAWYSLDGIRLNGKPTQRGLYINNGKKTLIK